MFSIFGGRIMSLLERGLNAASVQHLVISDNIANVDTPGYKRGEVVFKDQFKHAIRDVELRLASTNPRHLSARSSDKDPAVEVFRVNDTTMRNDGNNVDVEREMGRLVENSIHYGALVRQISERFRTLEMMITEGRR